MSALLAMVVLLIIDILCQWDILKRKRKTMKYSSQEVIKVIRSLFLYEDASQLSSYQVGVLNSVMPKDWAAKVFFQYKQEPRKARLIMVRS